MLMVVVVVLVMKYCIVRLDKIVFTVYSFFYKSMRVMMNEADFIFRNVKDTGLNHKSNLFANL
jgi:hypothetical protein